MKVHERAAMVFPVLGIPSSFPLYAPGVLGHASLCVVNHLPDFHHCASIDQHPSSPVSLTYIGLQSLCL